MFDENAELVKNVQTLVEYLGTFAFAMSGIRRAAEKEFDWFGGFVCGVAVAIGGGTLRDIMLGTTPFWMTSPSYIICTIVAQVVVIAFHHYLKRFDNAWLVFDTLGLALFTIAGLQKTLAFGHSAWVAIIMGCITGVAGGVLRDILLNNIPVIFQKEIYAMASAAGGVVYWLLLRFGVPVQITILAAFCLICFIRFIAVKHHISLPRLHSEK